jgi:hypothetical protein
MAGTTCFVCLVCTVTCHRKNTHGRVSASSMNINKLAKLLFLDIYDASSFPMIFFCSYLAFIGTHILHLVALSQDPNQDLGVFSQSFIFLHNLHIGRIS